jgi:hypothetical protein
MSNAGGPATSVNRSLRVLALLAILLAGLCHRAEPAGVKAVQAPAARQLPIAFEANLGQADPTVRFLSRGSGYALFLTPSEAVLTLASGPGGSGSRVLRLRLVGGSLDQPVVGLDQLPARSNYFIGSDAGGWRSDIPNYRRVKYPSLYPGVDLVFHGSGGALEYDFVVAPGADVSVITLAIDGAETMQIEPAGDVVVRLPGVEVRMRKPVVYQEANGVRRPVAGHYVVRQPSDRAPEISRSPVPRPAIHPPEPDIDARTIGFQIAEYDPSKPLIIDPVLTYSTYVGGTAADSGNSITLDAAGNIYVTGQTDSAAFPTVNAMQPATGGLSDAFVLKLDPTGSTLLYSTYLGGSLEDRGNGIAVDGAGNAYIAGRTGSLNFPVTPGAFQIGFRGGTFDAFVAKLSPDGGTLLYSTYLGGFANDAGFGIVVDGGGNAHVAGGTMSDDFPVTGAAFQPIPGGTTDAFVTKLDATGGGLTYSTYLGGSANDRANAIALGPNGDAYVTGHTDSIDFPATNAYQPTSGGGRDAFVARLNATGNALLYATYWGGNSEDSGLGIAVDVAGSAHVTGGTDSANFPTVNAYQPSKSGGRDAFVTKLDAGGSPVYSTYLGGSNNENLVPGGATAGAIAVDPLGNAYVTGMTASTDFPTANAVQSQFGGADDVFVTKVSPDGSAVVYSTYLGGTSFDIGVGIAVDGGGTAYVTGNTRSDNFPTVGAFQPLLAGSSDAFIAVISDATGGTTTLTVTPTAIVAGDTAMVAWSGIASPTPTDWIGLYAAGTEDGQYIDWIYVSCSQVPASARAAGSCSYVVASTLPAGTYEFRLFAAGGFTRLATSNSFTVTGGTSTALTVEPTAVAPGHTVTIGWSGIASPTPTDWIGLYAAGTEDGQYIDWIYVSCSQVPDGARAEGSCSLVVPPLPHGAYEARLFASDGMTRLATSNGFAVSSGPTGLRRSADMTTPRPRPAPK